MYYKLEFPGCSRFLFEIWRFKADSICCNHRQNFCAFCLFLREL